MSLDRTFLIRSEDKDKHKRLDTFLCEKLPDFSRSQIKAFFEAGHFQSSVKLNLKKLPEINTKIVFNEPEVTKSELTSQNIPLNILYEDEFLLILNKPAGMVVHPAPGNPDGTLVNALLYHCQDLKGIGHIERPGIVHRLDKGTTGLMVVAKEQKTHNALVELFSKHDIQRQYQAIVLGSKLTDQTIETKIGRHPKDRLKMSTKVKEGKNAITHLKVLKYFDSFSHVQLTLETGRTHQIRVHLSEVTKTPIINDATYGRAKEEKLKLGGILAILKGYEHPLLHAKVLGFIHPMTQKELYFEIGPNETFKKVLEALQS